MSTASCIFCRIAARQIPAEIIGEAEGIIAFKDAHPQAPTHFLVVPTEHIASLAEVEERHTQLLGRLIQFANRLARQYQLSASGYRVVINCGSGAGQTVWHLHLHVLGGRTLQWPPG